MSGLPKNLREFIVRDIVYIVGGGMVLVSLLYRFDRLPDEEMPLVCYLIGGGVAYVVGNALQDVFSVFRFVTTAPVLRMGRFWKWIYRRFTNDQWTDIGDFDPARVERAVRRLRREDPSYAAGYERVISGLILAATMAPCTLVSGVLVGCRWLEYRSAFDLHLSVMALALDAGLVVLNRLRAAQMARIDADAPAEDEQMNATKDAQKLQNPNSGNNEG